MGKLYTIRAGAAFATECHSGLEIRTGGQTIELDDDVAALHADKLDLLQTSATPDLVWPHVPRDRVLEAPAPASQRAIDALNAGLDAIAASRPELA